METNQKKLKNEIGEILEIHQPKFQVRCSNRKIQTQRDFNISVLVRTNFSFLIDNQPITILFSYSSHTLQHFNITFVGLLGQRYSANENC